MKRLSLTLALFFTVAALSAQEVQETEETDYQRYDLVRDENELMLESAFSYWQENSGGNDLHNLNLRARLEYAFALGKAASANHTLTASLPYTLALYSTPWVWSMALATRKRVNPQR